MLETKKKTKTIVITSKLLNDGTLMIKAPKDCLENAKQVIIMDYLSTKQKLFTALN